MIVTSRTAKWLQALPDADAAALLDAVARCAADPLANPRHCKRLASNLYEARISLPPSRQYRCMFGFRNGQPVLLSGVLKKNNTDHERAIRVARAELAAPTLMRQESAMSREPDTFSISAWLSSSDGQQLKVRHATRKRVVVEHPGRGLVELRRARLERDGCDHVNGVTYSITRYRLPHEALEHIA